MTANSNTDVETELARLRSVAEAKGDPGDTAALLAAIVELASYRGSLKAMRSSRDRLLDELNKVYTSYDCVPDEDAVEVTP